MRKIFIIGIIILLVGVNVSGNFVKINKNVSTVGFNEKSINLEDTGSNSITNVQDLFGTSFDDNTVFIEYGTSTWCLYCKYAHGALKEIYTDGLYDMYYVSLVDDKNSVAANRNIEYNLSGFPTVWFDGGYKVAIGSGSVSSAKAAYLSCINQSNTRPSPDIDVTLDVEWLGNAEMNITVQVDNNEASLWDGKIRVYVCEIVSSMGWYDTDGNPFTFPFLDYAFNEDINIAGGNTWINNTLWDGDNYGYGSISYGNIMVIAAAFNATWHQGYYYPPSGYPFDAYYVDAVAGFAVEDNIPPNPPSNPDPEDGEIDVHIDADLYWIGSDPNPGDQLIFDVYFGINSTPPLVSSGQIFSNYDPGTMEYETTYYWKIVAWDTGGNSTEGPIWNYTTDSNNPPLFDIPYPNNNSVDQPINMIWSISINDIEGDLFNWSIKCSNEEMNTSSFDSNGTKTISLTDLSYSTTYTVWVNATDSGGSGLYNREWFVFTTVDNSPPNPPSEPNPEDGEIDIDINADISWSCSDPEGHNLTYDIYFGAESTPPLVEEEWIDTTYNPGVLDYETMYYWQIIAEDEYEAITEGQIWNFTTELEPVPDLDCSGNLRWADVEPGGTVTTIITVENIGDAESLLDWEVYTYPIWGTWSFDPMSGNELLAGESVTIDVEVIAPDDPEETFTGEVILVNSENLSDICTIEADLATPLNKLESYRIIPKLVQKNTNLFPLMQRLLGL